MSTIITLTMPRGPAGRHQIDLDTLTPMARALAEAIAQTSSVAIHIKSRRPMRDLYRPRDAEFLVGAGSPKLDEPMRDMWRGWWAEPDPERDSIHDILEWDARKFPGWYPVADDWSDLPSSPAAREDDGITVDHVFQLQHHLCRGIPAIDKDEWMRKATKGLDGLPAPTLHNGRRSLWSEAEVRALFARRMEEASASRA